MKALVLDGSRPGDDTLGPSHRVLLRELGYRGWAAEALLLRDLEIRHCVGCFQCWVKTPGVCAIDDPAREVARQMVRSDLAVFLTPVTFGGYSYELKKALDRIICIVSPFFMGIDGEVHHRPRYDRYPRLLGLGVLPEPDGASEEIFATLVGRNAINLHSPAHAAGVVFAGQSEDAIGGVIGDLLATLEENQ